MLKGVTKVIAFAPVGLTIHPLKRGEESINAPHKISSRIGIAIRGWGS